MRAETLLACLAIAMAAGAAAPDAAGQAAYPARAVRMIVPFPPGGGTDITSRTVAQKLSAKRSAVMPELPTLAESGLPGFDVTGWYALLGPAGMPQTIVAKVQTDVASALRVPAVHARLSGEGAEPVGSTPGQFAQFLSVEI